MTDSRLWDTKVFLAASKNKSYRHDVRTSISVLVEYFSKHQLFNCEIDADDHTVIRQSDLTPDGLKVWEMAFDRWANGHDRGKDIEDVSVFDKALAKVRST